jgi:6-phosphofructokinase 1
MASRKIAVLTSGGDAPGMNAAIRAVTRTALDKGWEVFGIRNGYAGMIEGLIEPLGPRDVGGILQRGGTFLGSARLPEFKDEGVRARGLENLRGKGIDGLIVIGGNGSQAGALALSRRPSTTIWRARRSPSASTPRSTSRSRRSIACG